jgi:uncharacterized protein with ParB-like and HNH nuclease domain
MVVIRHGEKHQKNYLVIDGQQRLTTLQMIIALIRDHWIELNPGKRDTPVGPRPYEEICQSLLQSGAPSYTKTFLPNWHIRDVFFDYIQRELTDEARKTLVKASDYAGKSSEHTDELFNAYVFFRERIVKLTKEETLILEEKLLNDLLILRIDAVEIENAFILFDTLNNRGLDLTQGDLVKNLIFQRMDEPVASQLSAAMSKILGEWDAIAEKVSYPKLDTFLRYFLILKLREKVQKESISKKISEIYDTKVKIKNFVVEVGEYADLYALIQRSDNFTGTYKVQLNTLFDDLSDLDQATQAVFLLAALKRFSSWESKDHFEKLSQICRGAEILSFRWLVTGKNAQDLENIWRDAAIALSKTSETDEEVLKNALSILKSNMPNDAEFKNELTGKAFKSTKFVRYILRKIENSRIDNEVWVLAGPEKLDVEHIAPKTPDDTHDWRSVMAGDSNYSNIIYRLGNQTLLTKALNRGAKNNEYAWKRDYYEKKTEHLTALTLELLAQYPAWNQETVLKRSKALALEASKLWNWNAIEKELKVTTSERVKAPRVKPEKKPSGPTKTKGVKVRKAKK